MLTEWVTVTGVEVDAVCELSASVLLAGGPSVSPVLILVCGTEDMAWVLAVILETAVVRAVVLLPGEVCEGPG